MENKILQLVKRLRVIFFISYFTFFFIFLFLSLFYFDKNLKFNVDIPLFVKYVCIFSVIICVPATYYIYNVFSKKAKSVDEYTQKIIFFRNTYIFRYVILSIVTILNLVFLGIYYNQQLTYLIMILLVYFPFYFPAESKFLNDFNSVPVDLTENENYDEINTEEKKNTP